MTPLTPGEWLIGIGGVVALIGVFAGFWWLWTFESKVEKAQPWTYWTTFAVVAWVNYQIFERFGLRPISLFWLFSIAAALTLIIPPAVGWLWKQISGD
ncbi:hypothetical protein KQI52_04855 [bacterium]|nr:hypothetical protein [bacterium]